MFAKRTFSVECFPVNDGAFHQLGPGGSFQKSCLKGPSLLVCAGFIGSHRKSFYEDPENSSTSSSASMCRSAWGVLLPMYRCCLGICL